MLKPENFSYWMTQFKTKRKRKFFTEITNMKAVGMFCLRFSLIHAFFGAFLVILYYFFVCNKNTVLPSIIVNNYYCTIDNVFKRTTHNYNRIALILHASSNHIIGSLKDQVGFA